MNEQSIYIKQWDQELYRSAWDYASHAHKGQTYGSIIQGEAVDYINHVANVAMEVICALPATPEYDGNLAVQCALLHDTIEDTEVSYEILEERFGSAVADGVLALSKNPNVEGKDAQMKDSLARICRQPYEVWSVKVADRIANLQQPPHYWDKAKCQRYKDESILIRNTLHHANPVLLSRLDRKIVDYQCFI